MHRVESQIEYIRTRTYKAHQHHTITTTTTMIATISFVGNGQSLWAHTRTHYISTALHTTANRMKWKEKKLFVLKILHLDFVCVFFCFAVFLCFLSLIHRCPTVLFVCECLFGLFCSVFFFNSLYICLLFWLYVYKSVDLCISFACFIGFSVFSFWLTLTFAGARARARTTLSIPSFYLLFVRIVFFVLFVVVVMFCALFCILSYALCLFCVYYTLNFLRVSCWVLLL